MTSGHPAFSRAPIRTWAFPGTPSRHATCGFLAKNAMLVQIRTQLQALIRAFRFALPIRPLLFAETSTVPMIPLGPVDTRQGTSRELLGICFGREGR